MISNEAKLHRLDLIILIKNRHRRVLNGNFRIVRFHNSAAGEEFHARAQQPVVEHLDGAVLADAQENTRRQEDLGASLACAQDAVFFDFIELTDLRFDGCTVDTDGAFKIMKGPGMSGGNALG